MQKKSHLTFLLIFLLFSSLCSASAISTVNINELVENSMEYDKQEIVVQGEAIGEALERSGGAWVNINDSSNAIGIWMTAGEAENIRYFGDYKNEGDTLRITGIFYRNCDEHGGDVDIHCVRMEVISEGHSVKTPVGTERVTTAVILFLFAAAAGAIYIIRKKWVKTN